MKGILLPAVPRWLICQPCEVKWKDVPSSTCWSCGGPGEWTDNPVFAMASVGSMVVVSSCTPPETVLR